MSTISKCVFGKTKLGRMKRTLDCDPNTFDGVAWIPNFKGSQRGAVLKITNNILLSHGMRKRSQIDSINGDDISTLPFKRIIRALNDHIDSGDPFTVSFMIPEQEVATVEVFFRGKFCFDYIEFSSDEHSNNLIISNIDETHSQCGKLLEKSEIKIGYRVTKVKGIKVMNKKYSDIKKMIVSASNDLRVDYAVLFEEGELDWYTLNKSPSKSKQSKPSKHAKNSQSMATLKFNPHSAQRRRKSGNIATKSSRNTLKPKAQHVKKGKSFDFGSTEDDVLVVSPIALRKNMSRKKVPKKAAPKAPRTPKTPQSPNKKRKLQIGKVVFNTSKLGLTRRELQCDSDTFIDVDLVPNYRGSQRGAVLRRTNETLSRYGLVRKTSIQSINGKDVSSAAYQSIIHSINNYISDEETFCVAFQIPERQVKTVEVFLRGSIMEYMEFTADDGGNNCIIKTLLQSNTEIGKALKKKCALSPGYRVTAVKTMKVINKKLNQIKQVLIESAKDLRVQYLVVFEEGELAWYGKDDLPQHKPKQISARSADSAVSTGSTKRNDNSSSGYNSGFDGSDGDVVVYSSDEEEEIKEPEPSAAKHNTKTLDDIAIIVTEEMKEETKDKENAIRRRFIARIKNVCIAAPFDPNQTLLAFKKEILSRVGSHAKLKRDKNLRKRIKYIKLQTPNFAMLIDCNAKDKLCEIATRKDVIVLHTQSDDEMEYEHVYD
eukprot:213937_1